jgi:hypothetical protein
MAVAWAEDSATCCVILVTLTSTGKWRQNVDPDRFGEDPIKIGRLGRDAVDQQGTSLDNPGKSVISGRPGLA